MDDLPTNYTTRKRHSYAGFGGATFGSKEKRRRVRSVGCLQQQSSQTSLLEFMAPLKRKGLESMTAARTAQSANADQSSRDPSSLTEVATTGTAGGRYVTNPTFIGHSRIQGTPPKGSHWRR